MYLEVEPSVRFVGDAELRESGQEVYGDGKPFVMSRMEILRQGWSGEKGAPNSRICAA